MHIMCQYIVSRFLTEDQKAIRMKIVGDLISAVDNDTSDLLELLLEMRNRIFYENNNPKTV